jgi:PAS domain S-box-containing protein
MAENISTNKKDLSVARKLVLTQRVELLATDYNNDVNPIAIIDTNYSFVFANSSFLDIFQFPLEELKSRNIEDLFNNPGGQSRIVEILQRVEESSWSGKVVCLRKDKTTFNSGLKVSLIKDSAELLCGYEIKTLNIEATSPNFRKLFEFLLRLEKSYHAFPDLLIVTDQKRNIIEIRYLDIESDYFVYKPEENTKLEDALPREIVDELELAMNKVKTGPQTIYHEILFVINNSDKIFEARITRINPHQFNISLRDITKLKPEKRGFNETRDKMPFSIGYKIDKKGMRMINENIQGDSIRTKDGRLLSLEESYSPVIDENNRVVGFIARDKETAHEKKADEQLLNSDKKFNSVWLKSFDGMRLTDSKGNIVAVNPAFCQMFEISEVQLIGKPFTMVYQQDQSSNERRMTRYRDNFQSKKFDMQRYTKSILHNGKSLFLLVNYSYLEFTMGEPLVLGIYRDITELKKAQDELDRAENLAAIGKMSSYLSHEIKNPLASIKNYVDVLLNNQEMPANTKPVLNILRDSLGNLSRLLNNVLLFSSNIRLIKIDLNIYDLVEKVKELLHHKINRRNIQLKNNLTKNVIKGDYVSLQSVFFNMIENAIDAVSNGGIIEINDSIKSENYLVYIIDNGCGINEPDKIFEAFHSEKKGGTGLGLAIAKKIMELHDGNITLIKTKPGETIFELRFPSLIKG